MENGPPSRQGPVRQFAAVKLRNCQESVTEQIAAILDAEEKRRWTMCSHQPRQLIQSQYCQLRWQPQAENCIAELNGPRRVGLDVDR